MDVTREINLMKQKQYTVRFSIVELEQESYHILTKAKIGNKPVNLVIDTGASHSCFDLAFVQSLDQNTHIQDHDGMNVGVGSSDFESKISSITDFRIGRLRIPEYMVVLLDLQHINAAYRQVGLKPIQGILGCDFLIQYDASIDFQMKKMTLWKKV